MNNAITKEQAIETLHNKFPKRVVRSCDEYSNGYIVEVVPKGQERSTKKFFDSTWFVAKNGTRVSVYMPGMVPENEIKRDDSAIEDFKNMLKKVKGKQFLKHYGME